MLGPRFRQLLVLGPRAQSGRERPVVRCIRGEQLVPREARPGEHTAALKPRQDRRPASASKTAPSDDCSDRSRPAALTSSQRPRRGEKISVG